MEIDLKQFVLDFLEGSERLSGQVSFSPLQGDGSKRLFWRILSSKTAPSLIAMVSPPKDEASERENLAYLKIGRHLYRKGIPVPEIYHYDLERGLFLMEDLGTENLQDLVLKSADPVPIYKKVTELLLRLQIEGADDFDTDWCCQTRRYDRHVMRRYEADYFRDAFVENYLGLQAKRRELNAPFDYLAETSSRAGNHFLMHRDFQSRNILILEQKTGFVDWQGARLGPLGYDLASLLIDPYTDLLPDQRYEIYEHYEFLVREYDMGLLDSFRAYYPYLAIQRNLQILGAFAYLSRTMKKPHFEAYIPAALRSLHAQLLEINDTRLSPLNDLISDALVKLNLN